MKNTTIKSALILSMGLIFASASQASTLKSDDNSVYRPTGKGFGELVPQSYTHSDSASNKAGKKGGGSNNGIIYHGGPVMSGTTNVYYIWYGNWNNYTSAKNILPDLIGGLSGSPIFNINSSYYDGNNQLASNSAQLVAQVNDSGSQGNSLTDAAVETVVANAINNLGLPLDTNGVYYVLTAPDVLETSGFGTQYCGWHYRGTINGATIKYSFVGNPVTQAPTGCGVNNPSPNGDGGADAMASIIFHELTETITDPELDGWYDRRGNENADKCAWTFGSTYTTGNGATANVQLGSRDWLLQQNWVNANGGGCALSY